MRWLTAHGAANHEIRVLDLPLKVRLRFWTDHQVNTVAIWLADHGHYCAAEWLWRLFRMW